MHVSSDYIKDKIDKVRGEIGREISVFLPTLSACTICLPSGYYDTYNDASLYITCPVCKGTYWLKAMSETKILARVHWVSNEGATVTPGGKYYLGDANIHVDPEYYTVFRQAQDVGTVVIDDQEMQILKINPEGAPTINRYRIILRGTGSRPDKE